MQLLDLRPLAAARGYEIVGEYTYTISGSRDKRPGLDQRMADARRGRFDVVLVWAFDRMARSVRHFLEILDELNHLNVEFVSFRENIDTSGPLGRAMVVIVGCIAELEKNLIRERVKSGIRGQVVRDRRGMSLRQVAKKHGISRASVCRMMKVVGACAPPSVQPEMFDSVAANIRP